MKPEGKHGGPACTSHRVIASATGRVLPARQHGAVVREGVSRTIFFSSRCRRSARPRESRLPPHLGLMSCGGAPSARRWQRSATRQLPPIAFAVRTRRRTPGGIGAPAAKAIESATRPWTWRSPRPRQPPHRPCRGRDGPGASGRGYSNIRKHRRIHGRRFRASRIRKEALSCVG